MGSTLSSHSDADVSTPSARHVSLSLPALTPPDPKLLEQEPETLLCRAAASPLSPQPSNAGTPRVPSIRVWDPCHIISPPPLPLPLPLLTSPATSSHGQNSSIEVVLVSHGESEVMSRPDLVAGRSPEAELTARGERQGRALAVFLKSCGVRFEAVYSSPISRARATASLVCRELDFPENQIQESESLSEMSSGQWEGLPKSEVFHTSETNSDFAPPAGESLRQVAFRTIEFLNQTVLKSPEREKLLPFSRHSSVNSVHQDQWEKGGMQWEFAHRLSRPGLQRKKSGKSRLGGSGDLDEERNGGCVGIFTHATPIKCVITAVLECGAVGARRICVEDSSVTVLEHTVRSGWRVKRVNDTSHLRLL